MRGRTKRLRRSRDPNWAWRRALGHRIQKSAKVYSRKAKNKARFDNDPGLVAFGVEASQGVSPGAYCAVTRT